MITANVDGLADLQEALRRRLPEELQTKVLQASLAKAAQPIVRQARQNAPVKTGNMRRAIYSAKSRFSTKQRPSRIISVRRGKKYGPRDAYYWKFVEFGRAALVAKPGKALGSPEKGFFRTAKAFSGTPFMRPAFESQKFAALERFKIATESGIDRFARREFNRRQAARLRKAGL